MVSGIGESWKNDGENVVSLKEDDEEFLYPRS